MCYNNWLQFHKSPQFFPYEELKLYQRSISAFQLMNSLFTISEDSASSLQASKLVYFRFALWILLPSIIWSFAFGSFHICIEPLFFPYLERRLKPWLSRAIKFGWLVIFLISILANWNIFPNSYKFYLFTVLGNSPIPVLMVCLLFLVTMSFFVSSSIYKKVDIKLKKMVLFAGIFLLILKSAILVLNLDLPLLRKTIVTPSPFAIKILLIDGISHGNSALGKTDEPTFLNHIKTREKMPDKVVLMLVESWGESKLSLQSVSKHLQQKNVKVLATGFTDFHGSTMQGEIRELCSQYINLDSETDFSSVASDCAPAYMKSKGYEVLGVHGYQKMFYARGNVWKQLGIDHASFQPEMRQLNNCPGPFFGICDEDMISHGIDLIRNEQKSFLYMLSLSSHEPVASAMLEEPTQYFRDIEAIGDSQIVARNAIGALVDSILNSENLGCTEAYVVGDHQPPTAINTEQLPKNQVPYLRMSFNCNG